MLPQTEPSEWLLGRTAPAALPAQVRPQELRTQEGAGSADQHGTPEKATGLPWGPLRSKGGSQASSTAHPLPADQPFPKGGLAPTACPATLLNYPACAALTSGRKVTCETYALGPSLPAGQPVGRSHTAFSGGSGAVTSH